MNKNEIRYQSPTTVRAKESTIQTKALTKDKLYQCIGEFHQSNGGILYVVIDNSKTDNLFNKDRFEVVTSGSD